MNRTNSIMVIEPYRDCGTWVFDDQSVGLEAEPFVAGMPEIIDKIIEDEGIKDAEKGFTLLFSGSAFPGGEYVLDLKRPETGGNWYELKGENMEGWLCPALFKYFTFAPNKIFAQAKEITHSKEA